MLGKDSNMLAENGGYLDLTRDWAKRLMSRMGLVKHKATIVLKITPKEFADLREQYLDDIETISKMEAILKEMTINWDQTAVKYVPVSDWTKELKEQNEFTSLGQMTRGN